MRTALCSSRAASSARWAGSITSYGGASTRRRSLRARSYRMPGNGSKRATRRVCQAGDVGWALDLDGVVWLDEQPIPGAADAVAALRAAGEQVVFCTNLSSRPVAEAEAKLARHGIPAEGDVVTSAMAAARLVEPGERGAGGAGPGG